MIQGLENLFFFSVLLATAKTIMKGRYSHILSRRGNPYMHIQR